MKRASHSKRKIRVPDAINQSITKEFTQVPNKLLRNSELSFKAKGILCLLLSNKKGWYSYIKTIKQMSKEGTDGIKSGIHELEANGYLLRIQYREKNTKIRRGSFWAYTDIPDNFNHQETLEMLDNQGMEPVSGKNLNPDFKNPNKEKPKTEKPKVGFPLSGNPALKTPIKKNTKKKNKNVSPPPQFKKQYISLSNRLHKIVSSHKKININSNPSDWWKPIQKLVENKLNDDTTRARIIRVKKALDFYEKNIGGPYIPVIESGNALYDKFSKLENAIERNSQDEKPTFKPKQGQRHPERQESYLQGYTDKELDIYELNNERRKDQHGADEDVEWVYDEEVGWVWGDSQIDIDEYGNPIK